MFKNMKIGARLTLAISMVVLITLAISTLSIMRMEVMNQNTENIVVETYPKTVAAHKIIESAGDISLAIRNTLLFVDNRMIESEIEVIRSTQKRTRELIEKLEAGSDSGKGRELIGHIRDNSQKFDKGLVKLIELGKSDGAAATTYLINEFRPVNTAYLDSINELIDYQSELMKQGGNASLESYTTSRNFVVALAVLSALLSTLFGFWIIRSITLPMRQAVEVANAVSRGDLTQRIEVTTRDEVGQLLQALKDMNENLSNIVSGVRSATDYITTSSQEIAQGNSDLSKRTEEQASSLEETASSMEELTSTVKQNAENARQANLLAANASDVAIRGGQVVGGVVNTMVSISASSRKMMDIISVIEGIAFQTNILALNAAVEAARAGEQGRGFAVVAAEVRNLAQRSATAAKEISALIDDSVDKVDTGSKLVDQAGATMTEIVNAVKRVTDIMSEIAAASAEQSAGIEEISKAIVQMDEMTQQNAALVEEAASSAETMQEQANGLYAAVSVFKLHGTMEAARAAAVRPAIPPTATAATGVSTERRLNRDRKDQDSEWKEF